MTDRPKLTLSLSGARLPTERRTLPAPRRGEGPKPAHAAAEAQLKAALAALGTEAAGA